MSRLEPEYLSFDEDDLQPAADAIAELTAAGAGWVNFSPEVEPDHMPPTRNPVIAVFSNRGDDIPLATWIAPEAPGRRAMIGLQHGSGPGGLPRLAEHRVELPDRWMKISDHARRGIVVAVPVDEDPHEIVWWLLTAAHVLSRAPLTGAWQAAIHRP